MFIHRLSATVSLLVVVSTLTFGQRIVDLYRPLYEAQRGPFRQPEPNNVSKECVDGFNNLLFNKTGTLVKALDAFGRPEPGFLVGNFAWLGHFSECTNLEDYHYCHFMLEVEASFLQKNATRNEIPIQWGVCAPKECSSEDVHNSLDMLLEFLHSKFAGPSLVHVNATVTCVNKPVVPYGPGFKACMVLCAMLGILMIGGSIVDIVETRSHESELSIQSGDIEPLIDRSDDYEAINGGHTIHPLHQMEPGWKRILHKTIRGIRLVFLDFALNRNLGKLMKIGKSNERNIDCLNGIRVLSMFWVILGHIYFFPLTYGGLFNGLDALSWSKNFAFQIVMNAYFSVDSFFFLSGLLVCYITLLKLEKKNGRIPWAWFYIHRYIRLTPVMLVAILIWMYIAPYTLWGPKASVMAERPFCPQYWWANMFYIQNFYPDEFGKSCIGWTWYLANDMQFFLISPIIIYALYRVPLVGLGLLGALLGMSFTVTGLLINYFDFPASATSQIIDPTVVTADYGNIIYQKPYVRIPPYLVGMILGYALYRLRDKQFTINRPLLALGWLFATAIGMLTLFGLYSNQMGHPLGKGGNIVYEMFSRLAWGIFLSWVVVSCKFGKPGWVNNFLSWHIWIPLSRLTYTAYLLHPMVITTFLGNSGVAFYASQVLQVYYFCGAVVMSYGCALILSLAVEFPLANLEKHFMPKM